MFLECYWGKSANYNKINNFKRLCFLFCVYIFQAAGFLAASAASHALSTSFPIYRAEGVGPGSPISPEQPRSSTALVLTGMFLILVVGLSLGVLISTHRKKAAGITWFPEGFLRTGSNNSRTSTQRRVPDGQELRTMKQNNMTLSCMDMSNGVMTIGRGAGAWSDEDAEGDMPPAKRHRPAPISSQTLDNPYDDVWSHCNLNSNDNKATVMYTPPSRVS